MIIYIDADFFNWIDIFIYLFLIKTSTTTKKKTLCLYLQLWDFSFQSTYTPELWSDNSWKCRRSDKDFIKMERVQEIYILAEPLVTEWHYMTYKTVKRLAITHFMTFYFTYGKKKEKNIGTIHSEIIH